MKLLDLFCGEGGAGEGYARAGFEVFGVDHFVRRTQKYPYEAHCGDALEYVVAHGHEFDVIHASPPCTGYSQSTAGIPDRITKYQRLIGATRAALQSVGRPYVIENVISARSELIEPGMLCARMFGLSAIDTDGTPLVMNRHRLFESTVPLVMPREIPHDLSLQVAGVYDGARHDKHEARSVRHGGYVPDSLSVLRDLMDTPWMTKQGCYLAVPPAYTEYIGKQLITHLETVRLIRRS